MKLYRKRSDRDIVNIRHQLKNASGIKSDVHLPHGFEAIASFDFGNIYVDDTVFQRLSPEVQGEIDICLHRFLQEDYGLITDEEREQNGESKYFGNGCGMVAKYQISIGMIAILHDRNTTISLLS